MVAVLSAMAAGATGYNVIRPLFADQLPADSVAAEARVIAPEQPAPALNEVPSSDQVAVASRIRVTAAEPMPRFAVESSHGRDPFANAHVAVSPQSMAATASIDENRPARAAVATELPAVTAIVVTDRWRAAVIDGRIVAPGGRVGNRIVARIDLDAVQLRGADQAPLSLAYSGATQ
jgi:hypothetical protein